MDLQDLIITPIYILLFSVVAFLIRPLVTNSHTKKYFIPALWVKFLGAIFLGLVYQFYYGGGDTFNFYTNGSYWLWEAFLNNPIDGIRLLLKFGPDHIADLYQYSQNVWYWKDSSSYFIVRLTFIAGIFTFHTYSSLALFFAAFCFSGLWAFYSCIQRMYPSKTNALAIGLFLFPSLIFWGSGVLKDTVTLGAICWLTWSILIWFYFDKRKIAVLIVFLISAWVLAIVKIYILLCFIPAVLVWVLVSFKEKIRGIVVKILILPVLFLVFVAMGYVLLNRLAGEESKYALENLAEQAKITAYDIRYGWGARFEGDGGYDLGDLDGSWGNMIALAPKAVAVSLFRPFIWEVRNPLMLLAALESLIVTFLVLRISVRRNLLRVMLKDPFLVSCLTFVLLFSFAVGISSYNFGTLMRYKIPLIPFLVTILVNNFSKKNR